MIFLHPEIKALEMDDLSVQDLEKKITALNRAVITLKVAMNDVNCEKVRKALQIQVNTYSTDSQQMLMELDKRRMSRIS
jgi:predicted secreted Zn-dependent protease